MTKERAVTGALAVALAAVAGSFFWRQIVAPELEGAGATSAQARSFALAPGKLGDPGLDGGRDLAPGSDASATGSSSTSKVSKGDAAKKADQPTPPPAPPGATPPPRRPGGSYLYTGVLPRPIAPGAVVPGTPLDAKAAQLERAQDVADKRGTIVGLIAGVNATQIAGWAYDWNDLSTPSLVDVYVDGVLLGTVTANQPRPDFAPQDPQNPVNSRAWSCPSPKGLSDGDRHVVEALGYKPDSDAKRALQGSPYAYGGVQFPQGTLAYASPSLVYGWAVDPANATAPLTVSIGGDGVPLGTATTLGAGQNAAAFQQALALAPMQKLTVVVPKVSGPSDPNLGAAIQAQAQALAATNHYASLQPLAQAQSNPGVAFDELDFFASDAQGDAVPLPGTAQAGIKFSQPGDDVQVFAWKAPQPITASYVQARASSVDGSLVRDLQGSPWQLGAVTNKLPYGGVSFVNDVQISGWAVDPDVLPQPISVDVFVDGTYVQRIPADKCFAALPNSTPLPDANHAFCFAVPAQYKDGKTHSIQFFAVNQPEGVNPELPGSPTTFVGQRNANPFGFLDSVTTTAVAGWAYDPDAGASPTQVEIWVDNVLVSTVPANVLRPDLVPIVTAEPQHGFSASLPTPLNDGKLHTVRTFALNYPEGPKQELANSPHELNAQQPFFGIRPVDSANGSGLLIDYVVPGSAAQQAGFVAGDVIRSYDGLTNKLDATAFAAWAQTKEVGEQVVFRLYHDPSLGAVASTQPAPAGSPPLAAGERIVVVTVGSR